MPLPRSLAAGLCVLVLLWATAANTVATRAASGLAPLLRIEHIDGVLYAVFLLFLFVLGASILDRIATGGRFRGDILPLPRRQTRAAEWGTGAAIGWGLSLCATVPLVLLRMLHGRLSWPAGMTLGVVAGVALLAVLTLAEEAIFRGYAFRRLSEAVGDSAAAVVLSLVFAAVLVVHGGALRPVPALLGEFVLGLLLTLAYLRTHALWLGWGLHFGFRVVMAVLLGLPIAGDQSLFSPAALYTTGTHWLTGGAFGPDAGLPLLVALLGAMAVLYRATREFAWEYTHRPIVAGGYEVTVAPPPAHQAMERAAAPPPLVQILPVAPPPPPPGR